MKRIKLADKSSHAIVNKDGETFLLTVEELVSFFEHSVGKKVNTRIFGSTRSAGTDAMRDNSLKNDEASLTDENGEMQEDLVVQEFELFTDIPMYFTGVAKVKSCGDIYHFKNGKRHNENGPAIIGKRGTKSWFINNLCSRENGPAIEYVGGDKSWFYKGEHYGDNAQFSHESWEKKVAELKSQEV